MEDKSETVLVKDNPHFCYMTQILTIMESLQIFAGLDRRENSDWELRIQFLFFSQAKKHPSAP